MLITAFFTYKGVPKTGLFPTVNVWKSNGVLVVDNEDMSERAAGFYDYDFLDYDNTEDYTFLADGGSLLLEYDRYAYGVNDIGNLETEIDDIGKLIKQVRQWNISTEDILAGSSILSRNVAVGKTDYIIIKIKEDADSDWSNPIREEKLYAWYRYVGDDRPYYMGEA
jgi:hypothetical protein